MPQAKPKIELMWSEAFRAFLCMLPMFIATALGKTEYLVTLGQGAFFFSTLFLMRKTGARFVMGSLVIAIGLGFYLIGGNVAPIPWVATIATFLVCLNLSFLSNWKIGGPLALTFVMIYTAGLNTGSPERATQNFYVFGGVMAWCTLLSLLPIWKPLEPPLPKTESTTGELAEQGVRMGIGAAFATAIAYMFDFSKIGWAPSAVGNVVRYEKKTTTKRAMARLYGTVGGAVLAAVVLAIFPYPKIIVLVAGGCAILNGLYKKTKLGMIPLFYTATMMLLYSANNLPSSTTILLERIAFNLVGIIIGVLIVIYPLPRITKQLRKIDNPKAKES